MTDDVDDTALKIATLSLLIGMLDPEAPPPGEEYAAVLRELEVERVTRPKVEH